MRELKEAILNFAGNRDVNLTKDIKKYFGFKKVKPLVLLSQSGTGKTILLAKAAAQLISLFNEDEKNPKKENYFLLFSQLKTENKDLYNLLQDIYSCVGLHKFRFRYREEFEESISDLKKQCAYGVMIIDSLDESNHMNKKQWNEANQELSRYHSYLVM